MVNRKKEMENRIIQILNAIIRKSEDFGFDCKKYCLNVRAILEKEFVSQEEAEWMDYLDLDGLIHWLN